jgi:Zn-dependent alcohol dehydrogenase
MTNFQKTQAYVLDEVDGPFVLRDVVIDEVHDDEVLVEMKYTGLCHTVSKLRLVEDPLPNL